MFTVPGDVGANLITFDAVPDGVEANLITFDAVPDGVEADLITFDLGTGVSTFRGHFIRC